MDRYKMSIAELCRDFCQGADFYDRWMQEGMKNFVLDYKQHKLPREEIARQINEWVSNRHLR